MALLVGRDDIANFTQNQFLGFGGGNMTAVGLSPVAAGTGERMYIGLPGFDSNTLVRAALLEQAGGTGPISLVATADFTNTSEAAPQLANLSNTVTIDDANLYFFAIWGDDAFDNGGVLQMLSTPVVAPAGVGAAVGGYNPPNATQSVPSVEANVDVFWYIDGTPLSTTNYSVSEEIEVKGQPGTPISDRTMTVKVTDLDDDEILAETDVATVNGLLTITSNALPTTGTEVLLHIEDDSITELDGKNRKIRVLTKDEVV